MKFWFSGLLFSYLLSLVVVDLVNRVWSSVQATLSCSHNIRIHIPSWILWWLLLVLLFNTLPLTILVLISFSHIWVYFSLNQGQRKMWSSYTQTFIRNLQTDNVLTDRSREKNPRGQQNEMFRIVHHTGQASTLSLPYKSHTLFSINCPWAIFLSGTRKFVYTK